MPNPRRRRSRTRQGMVRSQKNLTPPQAVACPQCGEARLPHRVCPSCGQYKDRTFIVKVTQ